MKRIEKVPEIIIEMSMVDTYDGPGHDAEMINAYYPRHMALNGMKVQRWSLQIRGESMIRGI